MSDDWKIYRLGQITDWFSGGTPRKNIDRYWNGDIPWISASSMSNNRISTSDMKITNEGLKSGSKLANKDDILLLVRGSILHQKIPVGIVMNEVSYNQDVKRIKVKDNLNPWFLLYWFIGNEKTLLRKVDVTGIGAGKFDTDFLQNYPISLPSLKEQKIIVDIVKSLDDKIHLNNQLNKTLESIAQALFKSWFIDFDPVRAKIEARQEGKDPVLAAMCVISGKSEEELQQMAEDDFAELQATAALFPDEFVDSELGEVPKGWEITNINAVTASIFSGGTPSTKEVTYWNGEIPWLSSGETRNKIIVSTEKSITVTAVKKSSTKLAIFGDILIASAGQGHTRGQTSFNAIECYINQSIVALRANDKVSPYWLYYCLEPRYDEMRSVSDSHSSRGSLTTKLLASMPVILPTQKLVVSFDKVINPMLAQQVKNAKEIKMLADTRDALLPKLISGDIEVFSSVSETEYEYSAE